MRAELMISVNEIKIEMLGQEKVVFSEKGVVSHNTFLPTIPNGLTSLMTLLLANTDSTSFLGSLFFPYTAGDWGREDPGNEVDTDFDHREK